MYKLLIVDDEKFLRKRLLQTIAWEQLDITEVYEAENGQQALHLAIDVEPDIIITDINMPIVSGIDLMVALNQSGQQPKVIIISGYSEFEYAQQAIRLGAVDYILKPIDQDELLTIVRTCIQKIEEEQHSKALANTLSQFQKLHLDIQKELFFRDLLTGKLTDSTLIAINMQRLQLSLAEGEQVLCLLIYMEPKSSATETWDFSLLFGSVKNIIEECFAQHILSTFLLGDFIVAIVRDSAFSEEDYTLHQMQKVSQVFFDLCEQALSYQIGKPVTDFKNLSQSFAVAKQTFLLSNTDNGFSSSDTGQIDLATFQLHLNTHEFSLCQQDIAQIFSQLSQNHVSSFGVRMAYFHIVHTLLQFISSNQPLQEQMASYCIQLTEAASTLITAGKAEKLVLDMLSELQRQSCSLDADNRHWLVRKAQAYIEENYAAIEGMAEVAKHFFVSPSYFCKIFKQYTQKTFTRFLTEVRIQKAKELMHDPQYKLYEIAEAVGYKNFQYFSTMFKEVEGISPSQYKNQY